MLLTVQSHSLGTPSRSRFKLLCDTALTAEGVCAVRWQPRRVFHNRMGFRSRVGEGLGMELQGHLPTCV